MYVFLLHKPNTMTVMCYDTLFSLLHLKRSDLTCEVEDLFRQNGVVNSLEGRRPMVSRTFNENNGPRNSS